MGFIEFCKKFNSIESDEAAIEFCKEVYPDGLVSEDLWEGLPWWENYETMSNTNERVNELIKSGYLHYLSDEEYNEKANGFYTGGDIVYKK